MKMTTYTGVTRLLKQPVEVDGKLYPFAFDSDMPDHLHTSYRLMATSDSDALTDAALGRMIGQSRRQALDADVDKTEGRLLLWITVFPELQSQNSTNSGGNGDGAGGGLRVRLEKGPDLEMRLPPPELSLDRTPPSPEPQLPDLPEPRRGGPDMDMF